MTSDAAWLLGEIVRRSSIVLDERRLRLLAAYAELTAALRGQAPAAGISFRRTPAGIDAPGLARALGEAQVEGLIALSRRPSYRSGFVLDVRPGLRARPAPSDHVRALAAFAVRRAEGMTTARLAGIVSDRMAASPSR